MSRGKRPRVRGVRLTDPAHVLTRLGVVELVRLTVVANDVEAEQIRSLLRFEEIESIQRLTTGGAAATGGLMQTFGGEREILVRQADLKKAQSLIREG
jgi:hypothetical protein